MKQPESEELLSRIALTLVPTVGDVTIKNLISYCGSAEAVFRTKRSHLLRIPGIGPTTAEAIISFDGFKEAERELNFVTKNNIQVLLYPDASYPGRLRRIDDAPALLYFRGSASLNHKHILGIVGTRRATEYGRSVTAQIIEDMQGMDILILSGLAYGIDIYAHRYALKHQLPTIGVMAHGHDKLYPPQHAATAKEMLNHGGLLTEFRSKTNPDRENFPKRNRIVAGLCDALLVVETAEKGGAMITAELANSYHKEVLTIPGRLTDPMSLGCHRLIKQHQAHLVQSAADICLLMGWNTQHDAKPVVKQLPLGLTVAEEALMQSIRTYPKLTFDELCFRLQIDSGTLSLQLLDFELRGLIRALPGKRYECA